MSDQPGIHVHTPPVHLVPSLLILDTEVFSTERDLLVAHATFQDWKISTMVWILLQLLVSWSEMEEDFAHFQHLATTNNKGRDRSL